MRRHWHALRDWWHRQQGRDRVEMALEAAIFFATLTYVIVASRQLTVMRETLRQQGNMIEQNKDMIAAAKRQADAAVIAAQAAQSQAHGMVATVPVMQAQASAAITQAETAKNTLRLVESPDVELESTECSTGASFGLDTKLTWHFRNFGRTKAKNVRFGVSFIVRDAKDKSPLETPDLTEASVGAAPAGAGFPSGTTGLANI